MGEHERIAVAFLISMLNITYSLADQDFQTTASTGIYGISTGLIKRLPEADAIGRLDVLVNANNRGVGDKGRATSEAEYNLPIGSRVGRLVWDNIWIYAAAKKLGNEWLFLPKGYASALIPCPVRLAVYIHDIMPVIFADRYPHVHSKHKQAYFRHVYKQTLRQADVVFTNTDFTKRELERWAFDNQIVCPPVMVAGYGLDHLVNLGGARKKDQILVFIRDDPHKRADLAIDYLARWQKQTSYSGEILFVGKYMPPANIIRMPAWRFLGRVSGEDISELMAASRTVVHFTEYEGFGMPPAEAVVAGTPPVYSHIPPLIEVMASTGYTFDNNSYEQFALAMDNALHASPDTVLEWGTRLLQQHNWLRVVKAVVDGLLHVS